MDLNLLTIIIALLGVIITIWSVIRQANDTHLSLGVQIFRDLENEFNTDGAKKQCIQLANQYSILKKSKSLPIKIFSENSGVFDFFETVGILTRRRVLDIELVYSNYYYWFIPLWELAESDIKAWRKRHNDETYWRDCDNLYKRLVTYDARLRKIPVRKLSYKELENFMKELKE